MRHDVGQSFCLFASLRFSLSVCLRPRPIKQSEGGAVLVSTNCPFYGLIKAEGKQREALGVETTGMGGRQSFKQQPVSQVTEGGESFWTTWVGGKNASRIKWCFSPSKAWWERLSVGCDDFILLHLFSGFFCSSDKPSAKARAKSLFPKRRLPKGMQRVEPIIWDLNVALGGFWCRIPMP